MDGYITIGTRIDTENNFDKDAKKLESKIEATEKKINDGAENTEQNVDEVSNAIEKMGSSSSGVFNKMADGLLKMGESASPAAIGIIALGVEVGALIAAIKMFTTTIKTVFSPAIIVLSNLAKKLADIIRNQLARAFDELNQRTRKGIDNLAQVSTKLSDAISSLESSLNQAGNSIASAFSPVIEAVIPLMNNLLAVVTNVANGIAQITASLFGNATTFRKAKKTTDDYAKSLGGASKAAKGALASFDELNVLASQDGGGGGATPLDMFEDVDIDPAILQLTNKLKELWDANNVEGLENFGEQIGKKVKEQIDNLPAYEWARGIGEKVNNALALANGFLSTNPAKSVGKKLADIILGFVDGVTPEQLGKLIANIINNAFGFVAGFVEQMNSKDGWRKIGNWIRETLVTAIRNIDADTVAEAIGGFLIGVLDLGLELFSNTEDWAEIGAKLGVIFGKIPWGEIILKTIQLIAAAWNTVGTAFWYFMAGIQASINTWIEEKMNGFKELIQTLMELGLKVVALEGLKVLNYLTDIWANVVKWYRENVEPKMTLAYWAEKFAPIKNALGQVFKGAMNLAIDFANGMIARLEKALNTIVKLVNSLNIVNPFTGDEIWSPNLPKFSFDRIPRLARGGIVARPTQAIIGETGREAVMPLENNTEWMDMLAERINTRGGDITIRFTGSTAQLVRLLKPELEKEDRRTGKRLIVGGAY